MQQKNEGELHLQPNPCLTIYLEVFWWNDKGMHVYGIFISNRWVKGSLSIFECHFVSLIFNSFQNAFSFPQSGCKQVFFSAWDGNEVTGFLIPPPFLLLLLFLLPFSFRCKYEKQRHEITNWRSFFLCRKLTFSAFEAWSRSIHWFRHQY